MASTFYLASLASHIAVEIGDILTPPGFSYEGKIAELDEKSGLIKLDMPAEKPEGRMTTALDAVGIVWMHEAFVKPRPDGTVNHGAASSS
jgi:hypothetical protein